MSQQGFEEYTYFAYGRKTGTANSYITAINILDRIFSIKGGFELNGKSLTEIDDAALLQRITDFIVSEEKIFRANRGGFFQYGVSNQESYPAHGFCSAAMKHLQRYQSFCHLEIEANNIVSEYDSGIVISRHLQRHFNINRVGTDRRRETNVRIGQEYYRRMILSIYSGKCCVTGIDVPQLLRASHIVPWAEDKANRMNPENGLCLSGTYDLAFDQHLISFDENYRMIVGREIGDYFTNSATQQYFTKYEGKRISLPSKYCPNQSLLQKHRELLR